MGTAASATSHLIQPDYKRKPVTLLKNPIVQAISLVKAGANQKRFFLFKSEDGPYDHEGFYIDEDGNAVNGPNDVNKVLPLIKAGPPDDEWKAVYCVVAVPGEIDAQKDVWDADTIRDTAHNYLKKSRLINFMHKDLESVGHLVESAIAPTDMNVGGETIEKGSWFIAIEPYPDMKKMIEEGEINGVSVQGSSSREEIDANHQIMPDMAKAEDGPYARSVPEREVTQVEYEIPETKDEMEIPLGTTGPGIIALQNKLGIPETGEYDEITDKAVKQWMRNMGVPGKPVLATIKLILKGEETAGEEKAPATSEENVQAEGAEPSEDPQEAASTEREEAPEEAMKMWKMRGTIYHYDGDKSKTPLWVKEVKKSSVVIEFPPSEEGEAEEAEVALDELYKCDNPDTHYAQLAKDHPNYPDSYGGDAYNPLESSSYAGRGSGGDGWSRGGGFHTSNYGTHPENRGTQPQQMDADSTPDQLKAVILRALANGNELLARHLSNSYNINSTNDLYQYSFSKDELWGMVSRYILGRMDNPPSESMLRQPVEGRSDKSIYPEGAGFSMQKSDDEMLDKAKDAINKELEKVAPGDYHRADDVVMDKDGQPVVEGAVISANGKEYLVSSVNSDSQIIMGEELPRTGEAKLKEIKASSAELVQGDPAGKRPRNVIVDEDSLKKADELLKGVWSGSHGGHDPEAKGKIRYIVRSFGKWAKGKQSVAARKLLERGVVKTPKAANRLAAWLKDQWLGSTKWRGKNKKSLTKDMPEFNLEKLYEEVCKMCGDPHGEKVEKAEQILDYLSAELMDSEEEYLDELMGLVKEAVAEEVEEEEDFNEAFRKGMQAFELGIADALTADDLEKRDGEIEAVLEDFYMWLDDFVEKGGFYDFSKDVETVEKGWLEDHGKNQGDLPDSAFAWLSDSYKDGDASKTEGRKLPYKVNGKVDPDGWDAAWSYLDKTDFSGGPSKQEVERELLRNKPESITISLDAVSPENRDFAKKTLSENELRKGNDMDKAGNLKGATVKFNGREWIVMAHSGDELSLVSGSRSTIAPTSEVEVTRQPMKGKEEGSGEDMDKMPAEKVEEAPEAEEAPMPKKRPRIMINAEGEAEKADEPEAEEAPMPKKKRPRIMIDAEKVKVAPEGEAEKAKYEDHEEEDRMPKKKARLMTRRKEESEEAPEEAPEADAEEAPEDSGEKTKGRLARLLAMARRRKAEKAEHGDEMDKGDEKCPDCGMVKGMCKCGMSKDEEEIVKSSPLTATKLERIRETRDFLDSVLSYDDGEEEVEATAETEAAPEAEAEDVQGEEAETENEAPATEEASAEVEGEAVNETDTDVEKDVDASTEATMEVTMSDSEITMDQVVEAVNGLGEEVDSIMDRLSEFGELGNKLDQIGELTKSLDNSDKVDSLSTAVEAVTEALEALTATAESVEAIEKRLTALEGQPGAPTAAPVDNDAQVIEKSAPEEPVLFQRGDRSIF